MHKRKVNESNIFDRNRRRLARDRAFGRAAASKWLATLRADEALARLQDVKIAPDRVLIAGPPPDRVWVERFSQIGRKVFFSDPGYHLASAFGGVQADEDYLPFADGSFDLIISLGPMETVNDLPGALILLRRALRPNGLLIGNMIGGPSLPSFREASLSAQSDKKLVGRLHPQIEIRALGDLLGRAGFVMPVVDVDQIKVRYSGIERLIDDLRSQGISNQLTANHPMTRSEWYRIKALFEHGDGQESYSIINFTAWTPTACEGFNQGPKQLG